ncbi:MAG TPA: amino-acid racemase, partial [Clostridiales bacterium]|nr:amino-acid racemase [Clostridiales bacterium]
LKTRIILIRRIRRGECVGYGRAFTASRDMTLAVLPAGYADGVPRCLSDRASVLIRGKRAPIVGRICMDQMTVDITDIPEAAVEDAAVLIGRDGSLQITAEELAETAGTITNELLSRIGERVERIYL